MLNRITIQGRLVKAAELRYTASNKAVCGFTVACERDIKNADGKRETDFVDIVAWGNTAEFANKYFGKGDMAVVSGRIQLRDWTDKDGNKRRNAEVVADNIYFCESKKSESSSHSSPARSLDELNQFPNVTFTGDPPFAELQDDDGDGELPF